jgi:hypothetical protein
MVECRFPLRENDANDLDSLYTFRRTSLGDAFVSCFSSLAAFAHGFVTREHDEFYSCPPL